MAVTKIHPIKTTLKKAIDYICNGDKTDDEIYVTTHLCSRENAHKEFELTKKQFNSRTKTLAHHLIQSFVPEEVSFEEAHQVGIELCEKILDFLPRCEFSVVNIFDDSIYRLGKFDIILSRNMMIFFDEEYKLKTVERFHKILNDDGRLYAGHADLVPYTPLYKKLISSNVSYYVKV